MRDQALHFRMTNLSAGGWKGPRVETESCGEGGGDQVIGLQRVASDEDRHGPGTMGPRKGALSFAPALSEPVICFNFY